MIFSNGTKVQRLHADIIVFPASCLGAENGASFCYILAGHVGVRYYDGRWSVFKCKAYVFS